MPWIFVTEHIAVSVFLDAARFVSGAGEATDMFVLHPKVFALQHRGRPRFAGRMSFPGNGVQAGQEILGQGSGERRDISLSPVQALAISTS